MTSDIIRWILGVIIHQIFDAKGGINDDLPITYHDRGMVSCRFILIWIGEDRCSC